MVYALLLSSSSWCRPTIVCISICLQKDIYVVYRFEWFLLRQLQENAFHFYLFLTLAMLRIEPRTFMHAMYL